MTLDSGPHLVARLRRLLTDHRTARRFVIATDGKRPSSWAQLPTDYPVSVMSVRVSDTCKEVASGKVRRTVPRERLADAAGPWLIAREHLQTALDRVAGREEGIANVLELCRAVQFPVRVLFSE